MRNGLKKWMLWLTVAAAVGMLFIWLVAVPRGWMPAVTGWGSSMWATLLGCVMVVVDLILCRVCRSPATPIDHRQLASVATVSILCGAALLLCTLFDLGTWIMTLNWSALGQMNLGEWLATGQTPAPNATIISGVDGFLLLLIWVFGGLGGVFLAMLGFSWLTKDISEHGRMRLMALTPMLWGWMRLARYVVSYSSAVDVKKNLGEFLMLIFTILFFFSFARYVAAVGKPNQKSPMLQFYACAAFLFSETAAVVRLSAYWNVAASSSLPQLAGAADMAVGLMALAVAASVAYTRRTETVFERVRAKHPEWLPPEETDDKEKAEKPQEMPVADPVVVVSDPAADPAPQTAGSGADATEGVAADNLDVEDILQEIYKDKS